MSNSRPRDRVDPVGWDDPPTTTAYPCVYPSCPNFVNREGMLCWCQWLQVYPEHREGQQSREDIERAVEILLIRAAAEPCPSKAIPPNCPPCAANDALEVRRAQRP